MPGLDLNSLKKRIADRQLGRIHVFVGEDVKLMDQFVDAVEGTIDEADRAFAVERVYATEAGGSPVDIAAAAGTPVGAMADGLISVAAPDMYFTGITVMIDHGYGLHSVYAHLSALLVKVGQPVRKGQPIGRVGQTGRATGPHLHWGVYWFEQALDPALLVKPMPQS